MNKEINELNEIIEGAKAYEQELKDYIFEICDIIYMECPLEQQDAWLKAMIQRRLYDEGGE